jgi:POT family proton-dependent oligopeptide transporter
MYKHPKALVFLFFTEMWERFSFYGMRALLTLYLSIQLFKDLQDPEKKATAFGIYAAYGALVYATPFFGGVIADKFLGHKKSIIWGAILMAIGHFVMAIETQFWLYIALAFLIIGNGFFKPNISSMIGDLYEEYDPRRDGGFTIFYMGVNLGAFLSPLVCGVIGELYGWKYGFGIAGIGMILGLIIFMRGKKQLAFKEHIVVENNEEKLVLEPHSLGEPPRPEKLYEKFIFGFTREHLIYVASILSVGLFAFFVKNYQLMTYVLTPFSIFVIGLLLIIAFRSSKIERDRIFVILILIVFNTLFWAFVEQTGSSMSLYANENVNRNFCNWQIPASVFQSINPFFIIALGIPASMFWMWLAKREREPSTPAKFGYGMLLLSLGFLLLGIAPHFMSDVSLNLEKNSHIWNMQIAAVPMIILIASYFLQTVGELCQSPVGLSMITKLASPKIVGMVMGAWMLSWSLSHHFAGIISTYTSEPESGGEVMWKNFKPTIQDSELSMPASEFIEHYQSNIANALNSGFDVILDEGNHMVEVSPQLFRFHNQRVLDSTMNILKKDGVLQHVKDKVQFSKNVKQSIDAGIQYMITSGDKAVQLAIQKDFVDKKSAESYTLSTRHSLANLLQYTGVFKMIGIVAFFASLLLFAISPFIRKMMHGA